MSFSDFTFPQVRFDFGLHVRDVDLFSHIPPFAIPQEFHDFLNDGVQLALAINTEKARSEFMIAPVLLEARRCANKEFDIFSGVDWNVDPERGLNGYCDFILTKGETQYILSAPFIAIVEAKNDNIANGLGQCIAAMVAAQLANQKEQRPIPTIYGIVTTGSAWKFLQLQQQQLTIDLPDYPIADVAKIMGIILHIVRSV